MQPDLREIGPKRRCNLDELRTDPDGEWNDSGVIGIHSQIPGAPCDVHQAIGVFTPSNVRVRFGLTTNEHVNVLLHVPGIIGRSKFL